MNWRTWALAGAIMLAACGGEKSSNSTANNGSSNATNNDPNNTPNNGSSNTPDNGSSNAPNNTAGDMGGPNNVTTDMGMGMVGDVGFGDDLPPAGNPDGACDVPADGGLEDTSNPTTVVGDGTPASCTSDAVVAAVAQGGIIKFDCGPNPVTIPMQETAKIVNDTGPEIVIDGGGLVTLDGQGERRILYQNTCDPDQVFTTPMCQNQDHPRLTVQNLTFVNGYQPGESNTDGGGAIFVRGGRFKIVNSRFFNNRCNDVGQDVGGAAVRVMSQHEGRPIFVVNSTFGGADDLGNICSNGGGLSSIGQSWEVINSVFTHNDAIGNGANPARNGTPGGGSGGAIYNDGNRFVTHLCGTVITDNHANEGGGAIFFVSNNGTGELIIEDSTLQRNPSDGFENAPGIFVLDDDDAPQNINSTIE